MLKNFYDGARRYSGDSFMAYRAGLSTDPKKIVDEYKKITYHQSFYYVNTIADLLKQNGIGPKDRVAIYAKNSPLWLFGDLATMLVDAVSAPLYDTLSLEQIVYCLNLVGAKAIYCS